MFNFFKLNYKSFYLKKKIKSSAQNFSNNKYWLNYQKFRDPDGKIRNLSNEYLKKKNDLKNEISFLKKKYGNKKIRILDLGSGFGFFLKALPKKWDKCGIELSKLASKDSQKWSSIYNFNIEEIFSITEKKTLGKFDIIFSYHVIEHLKKPHNFLINVQTLLKKNGMFLIGTPNFDSGCAKLFKNKYRFFTDPTHISFFSENSLFRMLETYGFQITNIDYPYFETPHFNLSNLKKLFNKKKERVSPPFYGNIMTFYCKKKTKKNFSDEIRYKKNIFSKILALD